TKQPPPCARRGDETWMHYHAVSCLWHWTFRSILHRWHSTNSSSYDQQTISPRIKNSHTKQKRTSCAIASSIDCSELLGLEKKRRTDHRKIPTSRVLAPLLGIAADSNSRNHASRHMLPRIMAEYLLRGDRPRSPDEGHAGRNRLEFESATFPARAFRYFCRSNSNGTQAPTVLRF